MKIYRLITLLSIYLFVYTGCQTSSKPSYNNSHKSKKSGPVGTPAQSSWDSQNSTTTQETEALPIEESTSAQKINFASQLLKNDSPEEALEVLKTIPTSERNAQYMRVKHDAVNKLVMKSRYKVRVLYEESLLQTGDVRRGLLLQCKSILQNIIKNYPEYNDMYAVNNNLKQIERELSKK